MFTKTMSVYSIMSFPKNYYSKVINNIEKSRGYLSYIDSKNTQGFVNPRYKAYLDSKQSLYTYRPPALPGSMIAFYDSPQHITEKKLDALNEKYGVQDDYYVTRTLKSKTKQMEIYEYQAIPIECNIFEDSLEVDSHFEKLNKSCLSDKFIMNNHRRFMLLPFILKLGDHYVEPIVIANIYDIGIVTIQLIIHIEYETRIELTDDPPRYELFPEVYFYKKKENYKTEDFWDKTLRRNINAHDIIQYYEEQIANLGKVDMNVNPDNRTLSWVLGDFNYDNNKYQDNRKFIKDNTQLFASYLLNGNKEVIERKSKEEIDNLLKQSEISSNKDLSYYCTAASSVLSIGYNAFLSKTKDALKDEEEVLKAENIYEQQMNSIFRSQTFNVMTQYFRFFELSFIKRYFIKELLNDISDGKYKTVGEYDTLRRDFNFIKMKYDEEILFFTEGSPKELYKQILEKTNVNSLQTKAEDMLKNIREDISAFRDVSIKRNETLILVLTSIFAILFGYTGIKLIVNDVLSHLPYIGDSISKHPLRYAVSIWGSLVSVMVWLNLKRWFINKK